MVRSSGQLKDTIKTGLTQDGFLQLLGDNDGSKSHQSFVYRSYLYCYGIPQRIFNAGFGFQWNPSQVNAFSYRSLDCLCRNDHRHNRSRLVGEWAGIYGGYAKGQFCFYQLYILWLTSISGEDIVVKVSDDHRLKVQQCSQTYQPGSEDQRTPANLKPIFKTNSSFLAVLDEKTDFKGNPFLPEVCI